MLRRFALPLLGISFWLVVALAGGAWYLHDGPKDPTTVQTSATSRYQLAFFVSHGHYNRHFIYARPFASDPAVEWHYVTSIWQGDADASTQAWSSDDGNKMLVLLSDIYFIFNLKRSSFEQSPSLRGDLRDAILKNIKRKANTHHALSFSPIRTIGSWKWQDAEWKDLVRDNPSFRF